MLSFIKHPAVKIFLGLIGLFVFLFLVLLFINLSASSTGFSGNSVSSFKTPQRGYSNEMAADVSFSPQALHQSDFIPPMPTPGGYVPNLETFETTNYFVSGRLREFETSCDLLTTLKTDERYHFKQLNSNLNSCNAIFFTENLYVTEVLNQLQAFSGVNTSRNTESVTRHREQIQDQSSIIRAQLNSLELTLAEAETAYDEIAAFARAERDVEEYSNAIDTKLQKIDQLTNRKISLTSQLDNLAQQATDLEERIGVVEIQVSFTRSYTLKPDKTARAWEQAWEALQETWTNFGIGLTAYFGIFLLLVIQYGLYTLILIVFARVGWKVAQKIWQL